KQATIHTLETRKAASRPFLLKTAPQVLDQAKVEFRREYDEVRRQPTETFTRPIPKTHTVNAYIQGKELKRRPVATQALCETLSDNPSRVRRLQALISAITACEESKLQCVNESDAQQAIDKLRNGLPKIRPEVIGEAVLLEQWRQ